MVKRWVVKVGSSLVTNNGLGLDQSAIRDWASQIALLKKQGIDVILVSSGAIAEGTQRLNLKKRPQRVDHLQAAAAVGQMGLAQTYQSCFAQYGLVCAQILLTHADLANRERYLNTRATLKTLLQWGIVPIINENDTVVTDEIKFGDNDTLAALVTNLIEANLLVLLTDQTGLYSKDPRQNQDAALITVAPANNPDLEKMAAGAASSLSKGGMITKVLAAKRAAHSGAHTVIAFGCAENVLLGIANERSVGTMLLADLPVMAARKKWLADHLQMKGAVVLDDGAVHKLKQDGKSLLPIGVKCISGDFLRGDVIRCLTERGDEIARGIVNYSSFEAQKMLGLASYEIEAKLGYVYEPELIHRDNLVLMKA